MPSGSKRRRDGRPHATPPEVVARLRGLVAGGMSRLAAALECGVHEHTARRYCAGLGNRPGGPKGRPKRKVPGTWVDRVPDAYAAEHERRIERERDRVERELRELGLGAAR